MQLEPITNTLDDDAAHVLSAARALQSANVQHSNQQQTNAIHESTVHSSQSADHGHHQSEGKRRQRQGSATAQLSQHTED